MAAMKTSRKIATTTTRKKPTGRMQQIIVLVDGAGNYYEIPRPIFERSRVARARKAKVAAALLDPAVEFAHIVLSTIPGSTATKEFKGGRQLHYAGYYLTGAKPTR